MHAPLSAQVVPGTPRDVRADYLVQVSGQIGDVIRTWAGAIGAGDAARAARILDGDVHLQTGTGRTLRGRKALEALYARVKGRVQAIEVLSLDVVQSGGLAFVSGRLRYDAIAPSGASYQRESLVGMAFRESRDGWKLVSQVGGDFVPQVAAMRAPSVRVAGAGDTLQVRVLDAGGVPMEGVSVRFDVLSGAGEVAQPLALTDSSGIARLWWVAGASAGRNVVRASASVLEEEPVIFDVTTENPLNTPDGR